MYSGLTKTVLLMAFESDLGLKSISMSAIFVDKFLYAKCKIMRCIKRKFQILRRLRKISIEKLINK